VLYAEVIVQRGEFTLDIAVHAAPGELVAVQGRNGSGKSTWLAAVAEPLRPDRGRVVFCDRMFTDTAAGVVLPPHQRHIGLLAQQPPLFPHFSVRDDVASGPQSHGLDW
jgi:molybdate transport system ATP-binding protein